MSRYSNNSSNSIAYPRNLNAARITLQIKILCGLLHASKTYQFLSQFGLRYTCQKGVTNSTIDNLFFKYL